MYVITDVKQRADIFTIDVRVVLTCVIVSCNRISINVKRNFISNIKCNVRLNNFKKTTWVKISKNILDAAEIGFFRMRPESNTDFSE